MEVRYLNNHQVEGAETSLSIKVIDEPGIGNANNHYLIFGFSAKDNISNTGKIYPMTTQILFQIGGIPDNGVNGITIESLLAICEDRLVGFQSGPFSSIDNQIALDNIRSALNALHLRTRNRISRGVEGKELV